MSNHLVSLGYTGGKRVALGHILNKQTLMKTDEQKKKGVSKFTILCWATFIAILGRMWPAGCGLDTPGSNGLFPSSWQKCTRTDDFTPLERIHWNRLDKVWSSGHVNVGNRRWGFTFLGSKWRTHTAVCLPPTQHFQYFPKVLILSRMELRKRLSEKGLN